MKKSAVLYFFIFLSIVLQTRYIYADEIIIKTDKEKYKRNEFVYITVELRLSRYNPNNYKISPPAIKTKGIKIYRKTRFKKIGQRLYVLKFKAVIIHEYAYIEAYKYSHYGKYGASKRLLLKD